MKTFHAIMPISSNQQLDANYDSLFTYLNARHATIHLVMSNEKVPKIYDETAHLQSQQEQISRMGQYLKYEMLDQLAIKTQANYPMLTFEYHVSVEPLNRVVSELREQWDAQLMIVDQRSLDAYFEPSNHHALQYLVTALEMPIWSVSAENTHEGDIAVAIDLPANNHQLDQLNRLLLTTGAMVAQDQQRFVRLIHSWQLSGEQFMRQWLQLTDIDVARYTRVEKQQRQSYLDEYIRECEQTAPGFYSKIVEGEADQSILDFCQQEKCSLLVVGHNQNPYGPMGHVTAKLISDAGCDVLILPQTTMSYSLFRPLFVKDEYSPSRKTS
jgi:nucleotide-binding universal stress UspA family protein